MKDGWVLIFSADQEFKAKIAEDVLKQNNIISHILTTPDSAFALGNANLYTPEDQVERAVEVLKAEGLINTDTEG